MPAVCVILGVAVALCALRPIGYAGGDYRGSWAEQELSEGYVRGVIRGYPDGTLRPDFAVTRAEFAAMICRVAGEEENARVASRLLPAFVDVVSTHWATGYMRVCYEMGILRGNDEGRVRPDSPISRVEMVVLAARLSRFLGIDTRQARERMFGDWVEVPSWAVEDLRFAGALGLVRGDELGLLRPNRLASRAEAITVLMRVLALEGARWDVFGRVAYWEAERNLLGVDAGGPLIEVAIGRDTVLYRNGVRIDATEVPQDSAVGVVLDRDKPRLAAIIVVQ